MAMNVPRGFIMQWDSDQQKYVPMFVKIREDDIVWNVTDKDDGYGDYSNFFEYITKILQNLINDITNITWNIENPSTVLTALIPVTTLVNGKVETGYYWSTRIDGYFNISMTTRIPVSVLFENGKDGSDDTSIMSPMIYIPFIIEPNDGYTNIQISLENSSAVDGITNTSLYSARLYDTESDEVYTSSKKYSSRFRIIAKNNVYGITIDSLTAELTDPTLAFLNIMIVGKGVTKEDYVNYEDTDSSVSPDTSDSGIDSSITY